MLNQLKKQEKEIEEMVCLDISNDRIIHIKIERGKTKMNLEQEEAEIEHEKNLEEDQEREKGD